MFIINLYINFSSHISNALAITNIKNFLSVPKEEYRYLDRVILVLEYYSTLFLAYLSA